jgi:hypothetical protein
MSVNIPNHFVEQYTTNVAHLLQIAGGKLRGTVMEGSHTGSSAVPVDQFGSVEMQEVVSRFAPMPRMDAAATRRWVDPIDYELPQMVDTFDKLRLMIDPQSYLAQAAVKAANRQIDTVISNAFFATAKTGVAGAGTESFDTTNHRVDAAVGAAADTGLNVEKIIRARRLLQDNNVDLDEEEPTLLITPQQEEDLLNQSKIINTDYFTSNGGAPVLVDGRLRRFAGVNIIIGNICPSNSSYRLNPMWVRSGMHLGIWRDVTAEVGQREDLSGRPYQLYTTMTMGATRVEAGRVIQIESTES